MTDSPDDGSSAIIAVLRQAMAEQGGIVPFVQAMELLLYHPQYGYYMAAKARLGRGGDFVTAPEMTSLFGELLASQFYQLWQAMGSPATFQIVEVGGGSGLLALDIFKSCQAVPDFFQTIDYHMVEISPDFRQRQQECLAPFSVTWHTSMAELHGVVGVIFGNEVLDAFPVNWLTLTQQGWQEMWVGLDGERLGAMAGPLSSPHLTSSLSRLPDDLPVGYQTEIGLEAEEWLAEVAGCLRQGVVLMIDYGYPRHELYHPNRSMGTLMGFYQNQQVEDPLAWPGEMDITAHVDFTAMARAGEGAGLTVLGFTTQSWFLMGLGVLDRLAAQEGLLAAEALSRLRQAVMRLIMPGGMGERFHVLAMGRGLENGFTLAGFSLNNRLDRLNRKG